MTVRRQRIRILVAAALFLLLPGLASPAAAVDHLTPFHDREGNSFAIRVVSGGSPVPAAEVFIGIHLAGRTDGRGIYRHFYATRPRQSLSLAIRKRGFHEWRAEIRVEPGATVPVDLVPEIGHRLLVQALTERFGNLSGLAGMQVAVEGTVRGTTDTEGRFEFWRGEPGPIEVEIRHPQGLTPVWKRSLMLQGDVEVRRFFYPMDPERLRVAVMPFRINGYSDGKLETALGGVRDALVEELSRSSGFQIVSDEELERNLEWYGVDAGRMEEKGWEDLDLRWQLDLIIVGSVSRDDEIVTEVVVRRPSGDEILRSLGRATGPADLADCGRWIARAIRDQFPYREWVLGVAGDLLTFRVDRDSGWNPHPGEAVVLNSHVPDRSGRRLGEVRIGTGTVLGNDGDTARARIDRMLEGHRIRPGDVAVRHIPPPVGVAGPVDFELVARAGDGQAEPPLEGVNVYLDGYWVGRTDRDGRVELRLPDKGSYRLDLYRHGYGPVNRTIRVPGAGGGSSFRLEKHISILRIDSEPTGAALWLDGRRLGRTPLAGGIPVAPGDHEIRLDGGDDYRVFRQVVPVVHPREDLTGPRAVVLERDVLAVGKRLEEAGDFRAAIRTYREVPAGHSDAWEARRRLAFLLLGPAGDPQGAIDEFLILLSSREIFPEQADRLVEIFAGIGRAYLRSGDQLAGSDPGVSETKYLQALFYLQRARLINEILPELDIDRLFHDIEFDRAVVYQKLFRLTARREFRRQADEAWREYFAFAPDALLKNPEIRKARETGRRLWWELKEQTP